MITNELFKKYACLAVKIGINIQKEQMLVVNSPIECKELAREITEAAYKAGAKRVIIRWSDEIVNKLFYTYANDETLQEVPDYLVDQLKYIVEKNAAVISISAPTPGLFKDIDGRKMSLAGKAMSEKTNFYRKHMMADGAQWLVIAAPTYAWANKVFPDLKKEEAFDKLWEAILKACRVTEDGDAVKEWEDHMEKIARYNRVLNEYNFTTLEFKNSLGTNLSVKLVKNHIWGGGGEKAQNGVFFAPNIPTEETFTMPDRNGVNGKVVATMPLNYMGKLIENFSLEFENGKVVAYKAEKEESTLKKLLETDEGSNRLGEVALISHNSPISNMNILFYNTLFDENASCHLALGNAYTMNIKDGNTLSEEELIKRGYNKSCEHVDFMFGSSDMEIVGIKENGEKVQIFKNGNFVF